MINFQLFTRSIFLAACLGTTAQASGQGAVPVPSGLHVQLMDVIDAGDENLVRFRYLAPDLGDPLKRPDFDRLSADLEALCIESALPQMGETAMEGMQIVISLSEKDLPFGTTDPDISQVFEAFSVQNGTCILEMF